jgi:cell surface protein SprA
MNMAVTSTSTSARCRRICLHDGKKFYESGMPVDGSASFTTTQWGKHSDTGDADLCFRHIEGFRALQDVGLNGLTDEEEQTFDSYQEFPQADSG